MSYLPIIFKDKVEYWSCDYIVKETCNRSEKVDHLAHKYWCVLQGCEVMVKLQALYTERCIWDYTNMWYKYLFDLYDVTCHI